jgi:predicted dehydrogenase
MAADLSAHRLQAIHEQYPDIYTTTRLEDLFNSEEVEAVIVATPIRTHHRLARAALLHGKHVLVEKPLAASAQECEDLVELARSVGRQLMVGHTFQFNPAVEKLRALIASGELGRIFYIDCARLNLGLFQRDVNVLWDLAPHDISILLHILDVEPDHLSARGASHLMSSIVDLAQVDIRFPNNILAHVRVSWLDPMKVRRITVVGSRKMAVFDDVAVEKLRVYDKRVALRVADGETDPCFDYHHGDIEVPPLDCTEPLKLQMEHFVDAIRTGGRLISDGSMGARVVRIIEAADASIRNGSRPVEIWTSDGAKLPTIAARNTRLRALG